MAIGPIRTAIKVDFEKPATAQAGFHNRWHPDIPFAAWAKPGEAFHVECFDWTGGQVKNDDSADDILDLKLDGVHVLSGPIGIEGAEPGDVLVVEIQDIQPFASQPWGYTGVLDKAAGPSLLDNHFPDALKAIWDFDGIFATSRHIPHVKFPGLIHPGILGTMPSPELLAKWTERETELYDHHVEIKSELMVARLPMEEGVYAGQSITPEAFAKVAKEGARTIPPREHGGNADIKNLSRGSKAYLPVFVKGAGLSVGDLHFSQGDGEISFCGAIEMAGVITFKCSIIKNGVKDFAMNTPMFLPGPVEAHYGPSRYLTFEGISVDEDGKQHFLDAHVAFKGACLQLIDYFKQFGYSGEQIYLLLSAAPVQAHIASIVDIPNSCTTIGIPADIFDFDIMPREGKIVPLDMGSCAYLSKK
ncbi:Acetamidase/Formamidase [Kockiozyma suomiensis]|uniref:Acetamidase/Formamidase n=1 Tax=Kockiozyma suomiensis TaxID=1337062 RepID=UPI0033432B81